jgi:D-alanyl-D-alanine carboxypeptidase (penicillin-binding protein 5/6)
MKLFVLTLFSLCCLGALHARPLAVEIDAEAAILVNVDTGAVLYEKNPHQQHFPASVTKIATAAYALTLAAERLDDPITADREALRALSAAEKKRRNYAIPPYWLEPDGTHIGIKYGEMLTLRQLLAGLMVASANDAANVIAMELGGSIPAFVEGLNSYLEEIGCQNTHFCNPHGLHHPHHLTTAYDLAVMACTALKQPHFRALTSAQSFHRPQTNKQAPTVVPTTNRLLRKGGSHYYAKAIGIKTGYTSAAERTFVAAASDGERTLVAVLLKCKGRETIFHQAKKLFEAAFQERKVERLLVKAGPQNYSRELEGSKGPISTYCAEEVTDHCYPAEERPVRGLVRWMALTLPIAKDQHVADLEISFSNGELIHRVPLLAQEEVVATWSGWLQGLWHSLYSL